MPEFTKGPWKVSGDSYGDLEITTEDGKLRICRVCISSHGPSVENNATARLIAFAPKMYDVLKDIMESVENADKCGDRICFHDDDLVELLKEINNG